LIQWSLELSVAAGYTTLQRYTQIYPAGGANNAIFGITLAQLAHISGGTFADVKRAP
jgi:prolyl-tRNA editing enzyme YbaK/EbsC (Cys-tRNA(Pro) deacylase)